LEGWGEIAEEAEVALQGGHPEAEECRDSVMVVPGIQ
jgi:hypothetical protein